MVAERPPPAPVRRASPASPAHDAHERAAQRAAERLLRSQDPQPSALRTLRPTASLARGAGQPLPPPTRDYFERRLGHDLGGVRVHADAAAGAAARALGARAFTLGPDIAFAQGRYAPDTEGGRALLAHELAHVVQQAGGAPTLGLDAAPRAVQREVETLGGTWYTAGHTPPGFDPDPGYGLFTDGHQRGAEITLYFQPGPAVDAEKIGLTQTVQALYNGRPRRLGDTYETFALPANAEDPAQGTMIDRQDTKTNPIYGTEDTDPKQTATAKGPPALSDSGAGRTMDWGCRYVDKNGVLQRSPARLHDKPFLVEHQPLDGNWAPPPASQIFETTALAVKGAQAGTYYGSVRWGWRAGEDGVSELLPLSVVSTGVPSLTFRRAALAWNVTKTYDHRARLNLPLPWGGELARRPVEMTTEELRERLAAVDAQIAQGREFNASLAVLGDEPLSLETIAFERAALLRELENHPPAP